MNPEYGEHLFNQDRANIKNTVGKTFTELRRIYDKASLEDESLGLIQEKLNAKIDQSKFAFNNQASLDEKSLEVSNILSAAIIDEKLVSEQDQSEVVSEIIEILTDNN